MLALISDDEIDRIIPKSEFANIIESGYNKSTFFAFEIDPNLMADKPLSQHVVKENKSFYEKDHDAMEMESDEEDFGDLSDDESPDDNNNGFGDDVLQVVLHLTQFR